MTNSTLGWQDPEPEGIKSNATLLMVDYYERAFALFHDQFRIAHTSLAAAFKSKHGVTLDAVLAVVVALSYRVFRLWKLTAGRAIVRYWQRAYEGPYKRDEFFLEIM